MSSLYNSRKLGGERLERRWLLATYLVNTPGDANDGTCNVAHCSLREAIEAANASAVKDTIVFSVPGNGTPTITLGSRLPWITNSLRIDGFSQLGRQDIPGIVVDGSKMPDASGSEHGLVSNANNVEIWGLSIIGFHDAGILLYQNSFNTLYGNHIGVMPDGATAQGNASYGVLVQNSSNNLIGGDLAWQSNLISGNGSDGILVWDSGSNDNRIVGNKIGVNEAGNLAIANGREGISVRQPSDSTRPAISANIIKSNVVSGNLGQGIFIGTGVASLEIRENFVGTNSNGTGAIGNAGSGIWLFIGESDVGSIENVLVQGNVIAGNTWRGVAIRGLVKATQIISNKIGTDASGLKPLANKSDGVLIEAQNDLVHPIGTNISENVVSGNGRDGLLFFGRSTGSRVTGNTVGLGQDKQTIIPNAGNGIGLWNGASDILIGGPSGQDGNIVGGNRANGIIVAGAETDSNRILSNRIGVTSTNQPVPNEGSGIFLYIGPRGTVVGEPTAGNVIGFNKRDGISILGNGVRGSKIQSNFIGVAADLTTEIGNGDHGILIRGSQLQGNPPSIVFAIDRSVDIHPFDTVSTALVAQVQVVTKLVERLVAAGLDKAIMVGVTAFSSVAEALDLDPVTAGVQPIVSLAADRNNSGRPDIIEAIESIVPKGAFPLDHSDYERALRKSIDTIEQNVEDPHNANIILLTDGGENPFTIGSLLNSQVARMQSLGIRAFASGPLTARLDIGQVQKIAPDAALIANLNDWIAANYAILGGTFSALPGDLMSTFIGGVGAENSIAFNQFAGIRISDEFSFGNRVDSNRIYGNGGLGIDLQDYGITANDVLDVDLIANRGQNYPTIDSAIRDPQNNLVVTGSIQTAPNQTIWIDLYGEDLSSGSIKSEVTFPIGRVAVTTGPNGVAAFKLEARVDQAISSVTGTATDAFGNTSELASKQNVQQIFPDLRIASIGSTVHQSAVAGSNSKWIVNVENRSSLQQTQPWKLELFLSPNPSINGSEILIGSWDFQDPIAANETILKEVVTSIPAISSGRQYFGVGRVTTLDERPETSLDNTLASMDSDWFGPIGPDRFDAIHSNEDISNAVALGQVLGTRKETALSIHRSEDEDWFSFELPYDTIAGSYVKIQSVFAEGDLQLGLFDSTGVLLNSVNNNSGSETLSLAGRAAGRYYARVTGSLLDVSWAYDLQIVSEIVPFVRLSLTSSTLEEGQDTTVTLTRVPAAQQDEVIPISYSGSQRVMGPASVTLRQGQSQVAFNVWAVNNRLDDGDQVIELSAVPATGISDRVSLSISDNDDAEMALADLSLMEDATSQTMVLTGSGIGEIQPLRITASSSNLSLIPNPQVSYSYPDATGLLSWQPLSDQSGLAVITVTVEDGGRDMDLTTSHDNTTTRASFTATVNPVNDSPTLNAISSRTIDEDAGLQTIQLSGISAGGGESQPIRISAASSNKSLILDPVIVYGSANSAGELFWQANPDTFGDAILIVTVEDGGLDQNLTTSADNGLMQREFAVSVNSINDTPTIDIVHDLIVPEDANPQTTELARISSGTNEAQPLRITASSSNPGLIPDPQVSYTFPQSTGQLTWAPVSNRSGQAVISITLEDGGLDLDLLTNTDNGVTHRWYTVTVSSENDLPSFDNLADILVQANSASRVTEIKNIDAGGFESQTLILTATSDNPDLVRNPQVVYSSPSSTGRLTWQPVAGKSGKARITVSLNDGVATISKRFEVAVNAAPVAQPDIAEVVGTQLLLIPALENDTDLETSRNNLHIQIVSSPPTSQARVSISRDQIEFQAVANYFGVAVLTYEVSDGNGGLAQANISIGIAKSAKQNPWNNLDVNRDTRVTPSDALNTINFLNDTSQSRIVGSFISKYEIDVNGDGRITPTDALLVVNDLNQKPGNGESEPNQESYDLLCIEAIDYLFDQIPDPFEQRKRMDFGMISCPRIRQMNRIATAHDLERSDRPTTAFWFGSLNCDGRVD